MGSGWQSPKQMDAAVSSTRVVIADDHPLMLTATSQVFDDANGFEVVGKATTGHQVEPLVSRTRPNVVLLDLQLPGLDGLACLALLRERHPKIPVVIFSGRDDRETIEAALRGGAIAYIKKSIDPRDLASVVRQALEGNVYYTTAQMSRETVARVARENSHEQIRRDLGLTPREAEILSAVARGLSNQAVGRELFLSDQTVKFHLHKIYRKLRVANRTQATTVAHKLGLVSDARYA
jgi:DNA-binding NarL/FixJ family response regulator